MKRGCRLIFFLQVVIIIGVALNGSVSAKNIAEEKKDKDVSKPTIHTNKSEENLKDEENNDKMKPKIKIKTPRRVKYGVKAGHNTIVLPIRAPVSYQDTQGYQLQLPNQYGVVYTNPNTNDEYEDYALLEEDLSPGYEYGDSLSGGEELPLGSYGFQDLGFDDGIEDIDDNDDDDEDDDSQLTNNYGDWEVIELPQNYNIIEADSEYDRLGYSRKVERQANTDGMFSCKYENYVIHTNQQMNCDEVRKNSKVGNISILTRKSKRNRRTNQKNGSIKKRYRKTYSNYNGSSGGRKDMRRKQVMRTQYSNDRRKQTSKRRSYPKRVPNKGRNRVQYRRQTGRQAQERLYFLN